MIRGLAEVDRRRARAEARRQWRDLFVPIAIVDLEGHGRSLVVCERLETRWSVRQRKRVWRLPGGAVL